MSIRCRLGYHDYNWRVYMAKGVRPQVSKQICKRCEKEKPGATSPKEYQGVEMEYEW